MTARRPSQEKFAMIPESLIVGELLPGISTSRRLSALLVYSFVDLRQGKDGWPVKGFRTVAKAIGLQPRTVAAAARTLAEAGLIELDHSEPVRTKAVMRVIHNPARGKVNQGAAVGSPAKRYRHEKLQYEAGERVQDVHQPTRPLHAEGVTPDVRDASGSRSMRFEWFDAGTRDALAEMVSGGARCKDCLGFVASHRESGVDQREYCDCTFGVTNAANEATPLFPLSGSQ